MNLSAVLLFVGCLFHVAFAKKTDRESIKNSSKDSNTIAVFSEDDIAGKLPSPNQVAANIPKNLILNTNKKVKLANVSKVDGSEKNKKERKRVSKTDYESDHDRKSKSMNGTRGNNEDDDTEIIEEEQFLVVEPTPIASITQSLPTKNQIQIPTASMINTIAAEAFKIQREQATTLTKSDDSGYSTVASPMRYRRAFQKDHVKRAATSGCETIASKALFLSVAILFAIII